MKLEEFTNNRWAFINPLLPPQHIVGMKRTDEEKKIKTLSLIILAKTQF
jgi:hypothetical protein